MRRHPVGIRVELAMPGDIPPWKIAVQFIEALRGTLRDHDTNRDPAEALRLRMALGVQEVGWGDASWDGWQLNVARDLVGAPVIRRVLAAEPHHPLVLIASAEWYEVFVRAGHAPADGYRQVSVTAGTYHGSAWVRVPGRSRPPGLTRADDPAMSRGPTTPSPDPGRTVRPGNIVKGGSHGTVIQGGVIYGGVHIGNHYAADRRDQKDDT